MNIAQRRDLLRHRLRVAVCATRAIRFRVIRYIEALRFDGPMAQLARCSATERLQKRHIDAATAAPCSSRQRSSWRCGAELHTSIKPSDRKPHKCPLLTLADLRFWSCRPLCSCRPAWSPAAEPIRSEPNQKQAVSHRCTTCSM